MNLSMGAVLPVLAAAIWDGLPSLLVRITLITAVGACVCALLGRASAATRHLTAITTLAVLIGLPIASFLLPPVSLPILPAKAPATHRVREPAMRMTGISRVVVSDRHRETSAGITTPAAPELSGNRILDVGILLAVGVTLALLLHVLVSFTAAWVTVRRARPIADPPLRRALDEARELLGVSRPVDLRESADIGVPVVWGFFRPVLLLPPGARGWTRDELRVVFLHEMAHVARHDANGLLLSRFATSLFWFHPLVWRLAGIVRRECERSCDDLVLAAGERPTDYAERLLAVVRSISRHDPFGGVAPALAQRSNLEGRLRSILRPDQRRGSISRAGLAAMIGSASVLLVATAVVHVVSAHPVGRLVDPRAMAAPEEGAGSGLRRIEYRRPAVPPPSAPSSEGADRFQAGQEAFQGKEYVRAASSYMAAAGAGYRFPESLHRAAEALAKAGANEDAIRTLEVAIEAGFDGTGIASDPNLQGLRDDPRFAALLNPQPCPTVPTTPVVLPPGYQVAGRVPLKNAEAADQSGIELLRAGQYDRAIAAFEEEVRETGSTNSMYNIACAYALRGDKRRAFDALQRAIENGFGNTQQMVQDDDLRLLQGDPHFYELVRLANDLQLMGPGAFGFGMNGKQDWSESVSRFERVTREHPNVGRAWANLGFARLEAGDPKGGAAAYRRALDLGYQSPTTMYNLACCAARAGATDEAFGWLDKADKAGFEVGEHIGSDDDLDALRGDRRYDELLERWDQKMAKKHMDHMDKEKGKEGYKTY